MVSDALGPKDVLGQIKDDQIEFVDFKFVDIFGMLQHVTAAADTVSETTFNRGIGFDGSSVRGFQNINESDMILMPDPESAFIDPFFDRPVLSMFCDVIDPRGMTPYTRDPRGVARRAERLLRSEGIADTANLGPELEFFIFDSVSFSQETQHGYYFLNSDSASWNTGLQDDINRGHQAAVKQAYFAAPPVDNYHNLRSDIAQMLRQCGLSPELHHHEVGAAGQCEIGFRFGPLKHQADAATKYKYIVKNMVSKLGKTATFMPKPLLGENGSGMHVNVSLEKQGQNLFYDPNGSYAELSQMAIHFVGGVLKHARSVCAFTNPTTNSYRRLVPGYEAPMTLVYSSRNRSASVRVPETAGENRAKRIEFRTPDPSANPYLAFSAVLMAGIDGIRNEIEPPPPLEEDIFEMIEADEAGHIRSAPASLEEAINALEADHEFLVKDGVFTPDMVQTWIDYKRANEIDYVRIKPHPAEFELYYNS
jgi:glutamine synthetase